MRRGDDSKSGWSRSVDNAGGSLDWELRPGGMVVQVRDPNASAALAGPMIKVKVSYGLSIHEVSIAAHSTFGELKKILVEDTGLHPKQQRLLYKGKEKDSKDYLRDAGVKDKSKIVLVEDSASWEKRLIELKRNEAMEKAWKAVDDVKKEADKIAAQIPAIEAAVLGGKKLADNEFTGLSDRLMCQLVKLDGVKAEGDAKVQRRILVRRLQKCLEGLDALKTKNDIPNHHGSPVITNTLKNKSDIPNHHGSPVITTTWPAFDGSSSLTATTPSTSVSSMADWERFD